MNFDLHNLYETIYSDLKQYISKNSIYQPKCVKYKPNEISLFPLMTCVEGKSEHSFTTLKYTDEIYSYDIMEINVFAQNKTVNGEQISGMTIKDEIISHIRKYFRDVYKLNVKVTPNAPNLDNSIYRGIINVSCKVDTKFKDRLIIYPR